MLDTKWSNVEASEVSILEEILGCFFLCRTGFTMVQTAGLMVYMRINRANGANAREPMICV